MALRSFIQEPEFTSKFQKHESAWINCLMSELDDGSPRKTTLHYHQIKAVLDTKIAFCRNAFPGQPSLIIAPTGSGKSGIVALLPYILGSAKVLVLSPSPLITNQLAETFGASGAQQSFYMKCKLVESSDAHIILEDVKVISQTDQIQSMGMSNFVVVNAQKFSGTSKMSLTGGGEIQNVRNEFEPFTTIIVDEAHHYAAPTWQAILDNFHEKQVVFLTATEYKTGGVPIFPNQRITHKILKRDIEGTIIRKSRFDIIENVEGLSATESLNYWLTTTLDSHDQLVPSVNHKAMILVARKDGAETLAEDLGGTFATSEKRTDSHDKEFRRGKYRVMVVCGKFVEGYDNSDVSVCVIMRNVKSAVLFGQFVGRSLRISPGIPEDVTAVIGSPAEYNQDIMWQDYQNPTVAENDTMDPEESF